VPSPQVPDPLDALCAAFGHDVGGTELDAEVGAVGVPAHQDDPPGAEPLCREDGAQADRAVADDGHRGPRVHPGLHRAVVPGREHVGQAQQRRQQCRVGADGQLHQRALGLRDADGLALAAVDAVAGPQPAVPAGCLQPFPAEVTGPVGPDERREDQIAAGETLDLRADLLDDAQELVPDPLAGVAVRHRAVRP
jgi:hypothetical protein